MQKELSVIIPAYNEEARVAHTLRQTAEYLRARGYLFEILLMNDGSADSTGQVVSALVKDYPEVRLFDREKNCGKGFTVKEGIREARLYFSLFMDADGSTSIEEWEKFEKCFKGGARAVTASRHMPGSQITAPQPLLRRWLGTGYRALCRRMFGLENSDINCGFKAYETTLAKEIYPQVVMRDWTFDVEVLCLMKEKGIQVTEVPVRWRHEGKRSGIPPFRTAWRTLFSLRDLKKRFSKGDTVEN